VLSAAPLKLRPLVAAVVLAAASSSVASASDVAIIVHPASPLALLSLADLARVFRLDQPRWKSGDHIDLVLQAVVSVKQEVILGRVYRMRDAELQAFWSKKVFHGELSVPPRLFAADVSVKSYVAAHPFAIGYIDASLADDTVKVVRIDGKLPGEAGYVLAREAAATPTSVPPPATPSVEP
jgi:hypothetical protein